MDLRIKERREKAESIADGLQCVANIKETLNGMKQTKHFYSINIFTENET